MKSYRYILCYFLTLFCLIGCQDATLDPLASNGAITKDTVPTDTIIPDPTPSDTLKKDTIIIGPTGADYFPLAVGNKWVYRIEESAAGLAGFERYISGKETQKNTGLEDSIDVFEGFDAFVYADSAASYNIAACKLKSGSVYTHLYDKFYFSSLGFLRKLLEMPLAAGKGWSNDFVGRSEIFNVEMKFDTTFGGYELKDCIAVLKFEYVKSTGVTTQLARTVYAPNIGIIKEEVLYADGQQPRVMILTEYVTGGTSKYFK